MFREKKCTLLFYAVGAACSTHIILIDFIILSIFGDE